MAIASSDTVSETYCVRDIKRIWPNAFCTSGGTFYFGYIDTDDHAVVHSSADNGMTWSLMWDFGIRTGITVTTSLSGDIVATYWDSQIRVAVNGAEVSLGSLALTGTDPSILLAVCYYPLLIIGSTNDGDRTSTTTVRVDSNPSWGVDLGGTGGLGGTTAWWEGVDCVLGYSSDGQYVGITIFAASTDVSQSWIAAYYVPIAGGDAIRVGFLFGNGSIVGPTDPTGVWPGLYEGQAKCGWRSFPNFEGVGTGYSHFNIGPGYLSMAAFYSPGLNNDATIIGPSVRADRGMLGVHQAAFCCRMDGQLTFAFRDSTGLIGSTVLTDDLDVVDSNRLSAPYSRSRAYGTLPGLSTALMWGEANQTGGHLTFFVLTSEIPASSGPSIITSGGRSGVIESGANMNLVRIADKAVNTNRRASNVQLRSKVTTTTITTARPTGVALGTIREDGGASRYDLSTLVAALTGSSGLVDNPNNSPGCSPVLRALLEQSGVPFSVTREVFNDGDPNAHAGGNALDIAGPDTALASNSASEGNSQAMSVLCDLLATVPSLFATVIHYDPVTGHSLFIWDGKITTVNQFGGVDAQVVQDSINSIHISSSKTRLLNGLQDPAVQATLGAAPPVTDPATGLPTGRDTPDPFNADSFVYIAADNFSDGSGNPLNAGNAQIHGADFW